MLQAGSNIDAHLLALHAAAEASIRSAYERHGAALGKLLQLDLDVEHWERRLDGRPELPQLTAARRELGFAIYAASSALYAHAYAGVRLFLELSFASVYFSANELHRRQWASDRADFSWPKALDEQDGVLGTQFVREFNEYAVADAADQAAIAAKAYRHCSQFVHGKLAVTKSLPETLSFSEPVLSDWLSTAQESARAVVFLLYTRYGNELLATDSDGRLSQTLESSFGHLRGVRSHLGLPIEE